MRGSPKVVLLLAALVLVAALVYLLLPPYAGFVPGFSARANTRNDLHQLRDAVKAFSKEYGYPPPADPPKLLKILGGEAVDGYNWRKIPFMAYRGPQKRYGFITSPGAFNGKGELLDGWGGTYVWDTRPPHGKLGVWSRLKFQRADRPTAMKRDFYEVVIE